MSRWARWRIALRQWACGLTGHDDLLAFGERRIFLRCCLCQRETAGFGYDDGTKPGRWKTETNGATK